MNQDPRFLRSIPEGVSSLSGRNPSIQCIDKSLSSPLTSRPMRRPVVGHKDFCCLLDGRDVPNDAAMQDFDGWLEPDAADHGAAR